MTQRVTRRRDSTRTIHRFDSLSCFDFRKICASFSRDTSLQTRSRLLKLNHLHWIPERLRPFRGDSHPPGAQRLPQNPAIARLRTRSCGQRVPRTGCNSSFRRGNSQVPKLGKPKPHLPRAETKTSAIPFLIPEQRKSGTIASRGILTTTPRHSPPQNAQNIPVK